MLFSLVLCAVLLTVRCEIQNEDWIDPTDMLNYDAASRTMRKPDKVTQENSASKSIPKEAAVESIAELSRCQKKLDATIKKLEEWEKKDKTKLYEGNSIHVFKRYLRKILIEAGKLGLCQRTLKENMNSLCPGSVEWSMCENLCMLKVPPLQSLRSLLEPRSCLDINNSIKLTIVFVLLFCQPDDNTGDMHYDAEIILSKQVFNEIERFLNEKGWKSAALDDVLSDILINFKLHDYETWKWKFEDTFGIEPYDLFMVTLCLLCFAVIIATELWTRIGWLTQLKRLLFLSFLISFGWNWMYLYKLAFAQHRAEVTKMGNFDDVCAEKVHWRDGLFEWLRSSWTFQDDPCQKYYETLLVNPIWLVPPTKALAVTFTNFVTEPLKHIGQGIGEFIKALMKEIPLLLQIPVLIILAVAVLGFCYGAGRSVTSLRQLTYSDRPQPPSLGPTDRGYQEQLYPHDAGAGDNGIYFVRKPGFFLRGPYDRGDASTEKYKSALPQDGNKTNIEVLGADMLDASTKEHSKLATQKDLSSEEDNIQIKLEKKNSGSHLKDLSSEEDNIQIKLEKKNSGSHLSGQTLREVNTIEPDDHGHVQEPVKDNGDEAKCNSEEDKRTSQDLIETTRLEKRKESSLSGLTKLPEFTETFSLSVKPNNQTTEKIEKNGRDQTLREVNTIEPDDHGHVQEPVKGNGDEAKCNPEEDKRTSQDLIETTRLADMEREKRKESSSCGFTELPEITESLSFIDQDQSNSAS